MTQQIAKQKRIAQQKVEDWNSKHPVGRTVAVRLDFQPFGKLTCTRSEAQVVSATAVVWCDGISGAYDLDFMIPLDVDFEKIKGSIMGLTRVKGEENNEKEK